MDLLGGLALDQTLQHKSLQICVAAGETAKVSIGQFHRSSWIQELTASETRGISKKAKKVQKSNGAKFAGKLY